MAIAMRQEFDGDAQLYDQIVEAGNIQDDPPEGLLFHCAAEVDGKIRVFDLWRSSEEFEQFTQDRLMPAFQQAAPDLQGSPPEIYEVHNFIGPRAG